MNGFLSLNIFLQIVFIIFINNNNLNANAQQLTEDNWQELLAEKEWMIEFFAPWCPACNRLKPVWEEFTAKASELNIKIGAVDLTQSPSLSGLFSVTSLPTIYHVKNNEYRVYEGNRELNDFVDFVKNEKWKEIKPINSWLSPDSCLMKLVSYLFKVTIYFKDLYTLLTETYGLPNWFVLIMFVVATILLGLLLGIILIICIDYVCAPKKKSENQLIKDEDEDLTSETKNTEETKSQKLEKKSNKNENTTGKESSETNVKKRNPLRKE